ncbi:MAG: precorrin-6y C5,15-methyltransferase (decarboxylating) subunit CbiE [Pseudomonadota bacterium]
MNTPVTIIGMGMSPADLTARHRELIAAADLLVGGRRHLAAFDDLPCEKVVIAAPLTALFEQLRRRGEARVVVLASGDPLYYGIGTALTAALGPDAVVVYPNVTAVAAAFSRIRIPWQDAGVVSLHGRDGGLDRLPEALAVHPHVAVFTDPANGPAAVAAWLIANNLGGLRLWVFEQMGDPAERVTCETAAAVAAGAFAEPNLVVIESGVAQLPESSAMSRPDAAYTSDGGLITKREVRAVGLSLLELSRRQVVWDLGAGSGAVAVEAAALVAPGRVFAVERNPQRVEMIAENRRRFRADNLTPITGELPDAMGPLPDPDAVFVGGGGAHLSEIIAGAAARLRRGGRLVVSAVMLGSVETALRAMDAAGMTPEVTQVQISRGVSIAGSRRLEALNPVWLVHGAKPVAETDNG